MSPGLGPVYYEHQTEHPFLGQRLATESGTSDATIRAIELEAREVLTRALETAGLLLRQHQRELELLQKALVERETLERGDLEALWSTPAAAKVA
jgi:cell division protease FtsH